MPLKLKRKALIIIAIIMFILTSALASLADTINYTYDDLNRLTRVKYLDNTIIDYSYDEVGNRTVKGVYKTPVADFNASSTSAVDTLAVSFTDQTTGNPTTWLWDFGDGAASAQQNASHTYRNYGTTPLVFTVTLTASNPSGANTATKTSYITVQPCPNQPVRIAGGPYYATLLAAYTAAVNGAVIQSRNWGFTENLTINGNIQITLDGGYVCDYSSNADQTVLHGMITTSGGTTTIKNFVLSQ